MHPKMSQITRHSHFLESSRADKSAEYGHAAIKALTARNRGGKSAIVNPMEKSISHRGTNHQPCTLAAISPFTSIHENNIRDTSGGSRAIATARNSRL